MSEIRSVVTSSLGYWHSLFYAIKYASKYPTSKLESVVKELDVMLSIETRLLTSPSLQADFTSAFFFWFNSILLANNHKSVQQNMYLSSHFLQKKQNLIETP